MSDLISRQAAIDAIWRHATDVLERSDLESSDYDLFIQDVYKMAHRHIAELIQNLPSAEPVKRGRWVIEPDERVMHCSFCGWVVEYYAGLEEEWNFCPRCGADMSEVEK